MVPHAILPVLSSYLPLGGVLFFLYLASSQLSLYLNPLRKLPYPPGPKSVDLLRNARNLLSTPLWFTFTDWAAVYGSIMYFQALGRHVVVLNSVDDAIELLQKRSNNYSDRPSVPVMDFIGGNFSTALKPYGPVWHTHRRYLQQLFRPVAALKYRPTQVEKMNDMLYSLLDSPEDFSAHIKTLSVSIIMSTMYGYKVSPQNDPFPVIAKDAMTAMAVLAYPGASIISILPALRFLPTWFPGANYHHVAEVAQEKIRRLQDVPYKYVQDNLAKGIVSPSLIGSLIELCKSENDHINLKEMAATGYGAASDTTSSAIITFIYTMARFPNVQKKAQEELDRVVGTDRLPNYSDQVTLPYVEAICREVFRWRPAVPLGVAHASIADDVYNGCYIPAGTNVVAHTWGMTRDPVKYKNPEEFDPDRFFNEDNELNGDDMSYVFGFGRRICPGRHMARATVWLAMATILATFDIRPPKDAIRNDIPLDVKYTKAMISHAFPFKCMITPRSMHTRQLIMNIRSSSVS